MTHLTLARRGLPFNELRAESPNRSNSEKDKPMLTAIILTLAIVAALGFALRSDSAGRLISRRPYNNRYNDASGARDDHFG